MDKARVTYKVADYTHYNDRYVLGSVTPITLAQITYGGKTSYNGEVRRSPGRAVIGKFVGLKLV